ncbi:MAG: hypothetical protein RBS73_13940 [Prolixibacteraceae bacterium]|jgi:hypothetical protein|nr:hypothetical protein [Prolixibacteraceae bacterium]
MKNHKLISLSLGILFTLTNYAQSNAVSQEFSVGWANLGSRFIPQSTEYDYSNFDVFSPGFELQLGYHYHGNWTVTTGVNYQSQYFKTIYSWNSYNSPPYIYTITNKEICVPVLLHYNFLKTGTSGALGFTTGVYFAFPRVRQEIYNSDGNPKIPNDSKYFFFEYRPYKYSYLYLGCAYQKSINPKTELYAEPFLCHILKEIHNGSIVTKEYRKNFWYGIKIGINYSLKIKNHEK